MNRMARRLIIRFSGIYAIVLLIGTCMLLNRSYKLQEILPSLSETPWKTVAAVDLLLFISLLCITCWRLKLAIRYFNGTVLTGSLRAVYERMQRFPLEIFCAVSGFSLVSSLLYRVLYQEYEGEPRLRSWSDAPDAILAVLSDMGLTVMLAMMLFSLSRSVFRPFYIALGITVPESSGKTSIFHVLILIFIIGFFNAMVQIIDYGIQFGRRGASPDAVSFLLSPWIFELFVAVIFCLPVWQFRHDLKALIRSIGSLRYADRKSMHRTVPVTSTDEIGLLTGAFNELQASIRQQYDELDKQMRLAYNIQQKLLPQRLPVTDGLETAAMCRQCREVGGDFYDFMVLDERRLAVVIGDVAGKGMPAALLMSALMVLWRAEMAKGGVIEEVVGRINRSVYETLHGELFVTLGLAVLDCAEGKLEYVSAGHMAPYLLRAGELRELTVSSLPLGLDPLRSYRKVTLDLQPEDLLVFYTDGVIEAYDEHGAMVGFERWEEWLLQLNGADPLQGQLRRLVERLPADRAGNAYDDDRTVILVRRHSGGESVL